MWNGELNKINIIIRIMLYYFRADVSDQSASDQNSVVKYSVFFLDAASNFIFDFITE